MGLARVLQIQVDAVTLRSARFRLRERPRRCRSYRSSRQSLRTNPHISEDTRLNRDLVEFLESWDWDPYLLTALAVTAALYAAGWKQLGRRDLGRSVLRSWRPLCFFGGLATIWLALLSPIAEYDGVLFFMHMIQHLLLVLVAAPLLLLGAPLLPFLWALPRHARIEIGKQFAPGPVRALFSGLTHPLVAVTVYCAALAIWHVPSFYDAAQGRTITHDLEHAIFLGTALLFWWPVIHPAGGRRRLGYAAGIVYFLPPMLVGSLIGALLTFAEHPLYATYQRVPRTWGISVVQDQQLAGLIMWVPGGLVFIVPVFIFLVLLFHEASANDKLDSASPGNGRHGVVLGLRGQCPGDDDLAREEPRPLDQV